jgi:hypothetical protein
VTRARASGPALALAILIAACSGGRNVQPLRVAVTESSGDFTLSLEEPVRAVTCVVRDYRRSPSDPAATRAIWAARCTAGAFCQTAVRYGDRSLESTRPAERLVPSDPGACYECDLTGDHGHGLVRFRIGGRGDFETCQPRVGDL